MYTWFGKKVKKSSSWSQHSLHMHWTVKLSSSSDMRYNPVTMSFYQENIWQTDSGILMTITTKGILLNSPSTLFYFRIWETKLDGSFHEQTWHN